MRILILNHNDRDKGTFFRCFFLAKNLVQQNHEVILSCLNPDWNGLKICTSSRDGVTLSLIPGQYGSSSLTELPFHIVRALINVKIALFGRYDVVYSFNVASPTTGLPVVLLKILKMLRLFRSQIIVDCDDLWGKGGLTNIDGKGRLFESIADFLETRIPRLADKVTVVSHNLLLRTEKAGTDPRRIFFVPNGADTSDRYDEDTSVQRTMLGLPIERPILCFAGRALWVLDYLLASLQLVIRSKPETLVVFIAPLTAIYRNKIEQLRITDNIICPGVMPHEIMYRFLNAADVLLLPRVNNAIERSNFPGRLGDYLAAGRPIVASSIGDETERIMREYNCGFLADADNPEDFACQIIRLLNDPELRRAIGKNNRKSATDKLSWSNVARDLEKNVLRM